MSRQQDLEDMHALLQQMKDMHAMELDHCEWGFKSVLDHAKTKFSNMYHGKVSEETVLTTYFERKNKDARESFLTTLASSAQQTLDLYRALKNLITESNKTTAGVKFMNIDETSFNHKKVDEKTTFLNTMMTEIITTTDATIIFKKLITYVDLKNEILNKYKDEIELVKTELKTAKDVKKTPQ